MTPENNTWSEIGCLLNFIAQQISQSCLPADSQLLEKVLNYLSKETIENESARLHSERENAWHELLANNCLDGITTDEAQLELAKKASCHYVAEYLLEKLQRYDTILDCYLDNPLRHETMFVYMERYHEDEKRKIYEQLSKHIKRLLTLDAKETTRIVDLYFPHKAPELLQLVQDDEEILFSFLKHLQQRNANALDEQKLKLLELLCKFEPSEVHEFLIRNESYHTKAALAVTQQYKLSKSSTLLAEKLLDYKLAFEISLDILKNAELADMAECAKSVSALCARSSICPRSTLSVREREALWMELLKFILPLEELKSITKSMLHEASQHVDLPNLVQLVMSTHNVSGSFGDIKELLLSMLYQSKEETNAMELSQRIMEKELAEIFHKYHKKAKRGLWITMMRCVVCNQRLHNQAAILIVASCGHAMHEHCSNELLSQPNEDCSPAVNTDEESSTDQNYVACAYCLSEIDTRIFKAPLQLAKPSHNVLNYNTNAKSHNATATTHQEHSRELGVLQLKSPPRKF